MSSTVRSENIDFHVANLYVSSKTLLETRYPHIIFHSHFMFIEILTLFLILLYLDSISINIYRNENRVVLNRMGWINTVPLTNWKLGLFVLLISRMKIHTYKQMLFMSQLKICKILILLLTSDIGSSVWTLKTFIGNITGSFISSQFPLQ